MTRTRFTTIAERFGHIDARLVEATCRFGGGAHEESKLVVRFYPWWEHPRFIAARDHGTPWSFRGASAGERDVTVFPIHLREARLSERSEITDWLSTDRHPVLWKYEDSEQIFCNGPLDPQTLLARVRARVPPSCRRAMAELLPAHVPAAPFALGCFPGSIFAIVREELALMGVPIFAPREPEPRPGPVVLLLDDDDYLVADDFEVEVPEWEHRDEWFESPSER